MKLAIVTDAIFPYNKGGKETRTYELSTRLAQAGHDVHVYTMKWWTNPESTRIENGVTLHAISPKMPLYHNGRRSIREGIMFGLACFKLLAQDFDVADVDHMPYFPLFSMRIVCWMRRKPMIATWHEVWGQAYWREYLGTPGIVASLLERISVQLPDRIVAVSPHTANRLSTVLKTKRPIDIAVNGIDVNEIEKLVPANDKSDLVYVGRLLSHKNVDLLIRAVAELKKTREDVRCVIMSDGPERTNLENLTHMLGVKNNIRFTGFVADDTEKLRIMKASKVFVLPSTREGFGIVALEAMACGLPVVTVDHPDNAATHLITPLTGRLTAADPASMAHAIEELLDARRPVEAVYQARKFDWNSGTGTLIKVYAQ